MYFVPEGQHDRSQALRDMVPERPSGSFVHSSEKGIEYEDEDEHDSGRIARLERLFFCSVRDLLASIDWSSSDDRAVFIPAKSRPSPILQSFSFRNRPRPRTRLPSGLLEEKGRETQNTQLTPLKKPLLGPYCGAKTPIPVPSRNS